MLGAIVSLTLVVAAAYAVTQVGGVITLLFIAAVLFLAYRRLSLLTFTVTFTVLLFAYTLLGAPAGIWKGFLALLLAGLWRLNVRTLRKALLTRPFLKTYLKLLPTMSQTEREALEAGTVWWDGELFTGAPHWPKLLAAKPPRLSGPEQAFLDGPCEELCRMLDDGNITHERADLSPQVWEYLKTRGFFAMIIPKKYGGLEFSAYAHSCVLAKISSRSATVSSTVAVPNSLGPAELLNHYGTEEQKNYYLPRLARGEEVPCFALTGPRAGSDAGSIPDTGVVCRGPWQGREILGLKLNFSKRYITLAPVATVIGLAFRMFDPERLLGGKTDIGITCALIPRGTPGVSIGRRQGGRMGDRRLCPHPQPVQHAGGQVRRGRGGDRAHGGPDLHHGRRALGDRRGDRWRREALGTLRDAQVPRHRDGPPGGQRRHGRARRQGYLPGSQELSRPCLPGGAGGDHRRGGQPPHAQPHHLRPGGGALPSVRAARDERGPQSRSRRRGR